MFDALGTLALGEIPVYLVRTVITGYPRRVIPQILDDEDETLILAWFALMQPGNIRIKGD